ncbi:hypothetical protein CEXT_616231 [Caerostris extrusa]|uniref:Uncharacterized protein n=1 Tax=Caerostris extrusa TaxID=172846 RepID=A0AAV4NUR9_CAEEX|nr:hypothetical protein CEXT_616231 [Caerostris extrusa]
MKAAKRKLERYLKRKCTRDLTHVVPNLPRQAGRRGLWGMSCVAHSELSCVRCLRRWRIMGGDRASDADTLGDLKAPCN